MIREVRRLRRLLVGSWLSFVALAVLNASAVTAGWYCGMCR